MQQTVKTYAVIVNMDYTNHPAVVCKALWDAILQKMLAEDFQFEKRMFILSTTEDRDYVCKKAINAIENLDGFKANFKDRVYHYVKDFFALDLTGCADLMLDNPGLELSEKIE